MTDNERIKLLDACVKFEDCEKCPRYGECEFFYDREHIGIPDVLIFSLDLINRQKAEIERLQKECEITRAYIHNNGLEWGLVSYLEFYKNQKSEVIKEFAERLKDKVDIDLCEAIDCSDYLYNLPKLIDNLVKEMEKDK